GDNLGGEDHAGAVAGGAVAGHGGPQRSPYPLPGHVYEAQFGYRKRAGSGPVEAKQGPQLLEHTRAVGESLDVDGVNHDDAPHFSEPDLAGDLACCLVVGAQDGLFGVLLAGVPSGVHVDRHQRLGGLDDHVPAGWKVDPLLEEVADLLLDLEVIEQRHRILVEVHSRNQLGVDLLQVLPDVAHQLLGVNPQRVDLG